MLTFAIVTLGCKTNQYESQLLGEQLVSLGMREAGRDEKAGLCIVNTCAVTATAQGKSVRALKKMRRKHAGAKCAAIGCGVTDAPERYGDADILVGQKDKPDAARLILGRGCEINSISSFEGHSRAFLKVQDGCDSFCSYCIVPYLRGESRSKTVKDVVAEARALASSGYRELVLTGIHLGCYGKDLQGGPCLADLVEKLLEADLFPRLRLSGVEVNEVSDRLVRLTAGDNALCPHLHIPLQSGSGEVLVDMGRSYTPDEYMETIDRIRGEDPLIAVTTDVIVGFPTERQRHFEETVELCRRAGFSRLHVFTYSRRKGTAAARKWKSGLAGDAGSRSKALRELGGELAAEYTRQFVGRGVRIIAESRSARGTAEGYTDHYVRACIEGANPGPGGMVEGEAVSSDEEILTVRAFQTARRRDE